ncbi:hypothetical protein PYW08_008263 [Mythimna loreyi]|uniref:Uncharacterized protein n=1 Tax=Mythimna loreyi TaxID=667449 RepID=A0ACC2QFV4_9NEOP|nr:hypothetical protein PYW08_008263 [Mythimna loreyi]
MPPLMLEGETLGEKRRHFNRLVEDAIADKHYELRNIRADDGDINNLLKIDIAIKTRNVDYIIEVMKSNDMLYAATAIKKSTWLITEQQYAHIINPEYLHTQLLPSMNPKSFNKLMLHIRLNLKDETRVEAFYEYLKESDSAYKWLQNCSIPFIENVIKNERLIPLSLFKRLCRRSPEFIPCYKRVIKGNYMHASKQEIMYYVKTHTDYVLDVMLHDDIDFYSNPKFSKKNTKFLMKSCSQKVLDNFDKFVKEIDLSVATKYLNKKEIKAFLKKQVSIKSHYYLFEYDQLSCFIQNMPEDERFEFVKKTFITKTELAAFHPEYESRYSYVQSYKWYEFAPFNVALPELKKLIRKEKSSTERCAILSVLITCARRDPQHVKTLLKLVKHEHINEPLKFKILFLNNLLSQIATDEFDVETWAILDHLFHSMEVYTESENNVQLCLQCIVLYKLLHDEPIPAIVEQKIKFNNFHKIQRKLDERQNEKLFTYLFNCALTKIQNQDFVDETNFNEAVDNLNNVLSLLIEWKKNIKKYPFILNKIQELIKIRQDNMWKTDLSCLYNMKKSWRKHMFEESLSLSLREETCLNALKHKPQLLIKHDKDIDTLRTNDTVSLRRLLAKLRVYWPDTLAQHWTDAYFLHLKKTTGHKAIIRGLFTLLHQNQIIDMARTHMPDEIKVNWGATDQNDISIRQNIAKHLHTARPPIPLDVVLWYAKGDYLQHAVPSLNAILPNLSEAESRKYLPKLLDAPVSLQKFGLYLAVSKLKSEDYESILFKVWESSKNLTIRSVLFKHSYDQICKANNATIEKQLWKVLSYFIDNLTADESAEIYKKIGDVQSVPMSIQADFFVKSYDFFTSLPASTNCENYVRVLIDFAPYIMDKLDRDFVANEMLSPVETKFCAHGTEVLDIFASYILCGKSEEDQLRRYRAVGEPAIIKAFQLWDTNRSGKYYVRNNFKHFLQSLVRIFKRYYLSFDEKIVPVSLFVKIKTKIEKELPVVKNYVLYTSWKLITECIIILDEQKSILGSFKSHNFGYRWKSYDLDCAWRDIFTKIVPSVGLMIMKWLKEDIDHYNFKTTYCLLTETLKNMFDVLDSTDDDVLKILRHMLNDSNFVPAYIVVSKLTTRYTFWSEYKTIRTEIREILESHPSEAVRIHYFNDFRSIPKDNIEL